MIDHYETASSATSSPPGVKHYRFVASNYFLAMILAFTIILLGDKLLSNTVVNLVEGFVHPRFMNPWLFFSSIDLFLSFLFFVAGTYIGTSISSYHPVWSALHYAIIYAALNTTYRLAMYAGDTPLWYELCQIVTIFAGCIIGGSITLKTRSTRQV